MSNQAISKVELQKLINTKNSFVDLSVKHSLGINTDEFAKFPSFFDQRLTENQEQISSLGNELESVQGELTETQETLAQTQADLQEKTANLQAKTEELEEFTEEVNGVKDGLKEVAQGVDPTFITDSTAFVDYPEQFEKVVASAEHFGHTAGVDEENLRWTNLVNSATATEEDVAKGKTFVDDYGEIKDGMLDVETLKEEWRQEAYDKFWDEFQRNGSRKYYRYAFMGPVWKYFLPFKPKYPIIITDNHPYNSVYSCGAMFQYFGNEQIIGEALVDVVINSEIVDFSQASNPDHTFWNARIKEVDVDFSSATQLNSTFLCSDGGVIPTIRLKITEKCTYISKDCFKYNSNLETLEFKEGSIIACGGLELISQNKLSHDSIVSIINALSSTTSGLSVTVSKTAVNKAFETSEGANDGSTSQEWLNLIATKNNWTISLG